MWYYFQREIPILLPLKYMLWWLKHNAISPNTASCITFQNHNNTKDSHDVPLAAAKIFQWASLWFLRFPAYYETCKWHNTARQHILVGYFSNDNETQAVLWSLIAKTAKHRNIFPMGFVRSNSLPSKRWYSKNPVMISNYIDSVSNQAVSSVFGIKSSLSFEWYKRGYQHQFRSLQVINWFTIWSSIFKELKMFLMIRKVIQ